jgi:L-alanine-DL-glutamate epimerase-like enolase superfamily enzyme
MPRRGYRADPRDSLNAAGPAVTLTLDANQGYDVAGPCRLLAAVAACRIAFIEQPVPANDHAALAQLCARAQSR